MTDTELLNALRGIVKEELEPIKNDIADMKEHIENIETSVGAITDWIDKASEENRIPFMKAL